MRTRSVPDSAAEPLCVQLASVMGGRVVPFGELPVPDKATVTVPSFVVTLSEPDAGPPTAGANATGTAIEAPAETLVLIVGMVAVNGSAGADVDDTVSVWVPLFVNVTEALELLPAVTTPNATLVGDAVSATPGVEFPVVMDTPETVWMSVDAPVEPVNPM